MSSLPANDRIGANWTREELLIWDAHRREAELAAVAPAEVDGQQARLTAMRNAIRLGTGQIDGERVEHHWSYFRDARRREARVEEARHLLSMSGSETPDDPDDPDDSDNGPPPLEDPIPLEDASMAPPGSIFRPGVRTRRVYTLNANDLYEGATRPDVLTTEHIHQQCGICMHVKSHPVSYRCGHSNCYVCIRLWLERDWRCPECFTVMCESPFHHYPEEQTLKESFPTWDQSKVKYSWAGLCFPMRAEAEDDDNDLF
ncbi:hypothetical protein B0H14DRAFT_3520903 [Mycena olivaceomarginata]|nr:hypothetical protein B0H14DRAFT_3520903 [Mycena olivaceomarginata]